jgi:hypothetical protein
MRDIVEAAAGGLFELPLRFINTLRQRHGVGGAAKTL